MVGIPHCCRRFGVFIAGNLAIGYTFSTIAQNQLQAKQLAQFGLLPSMMLSGFMFPFQGMADLGALCRRGGAADASLRICRRDAAEGQRLAARAARAVAAAGVSVRGRGGGVEAVSADVGLR